MEKVLKQEKQSTRQSKLIVISVDISETAFEWSSARHDTDARLRYDDT